MATTLYNKLGYAVDQILSADQALPNGTGGSPEADSTNTIELNNTKGDSVRVVVTSGSVTTELAGGADLEIRPVVGTTTSPTTALPSIYIKQGVHTTASWVSGAVIADFVIPASLIGANRYLKLIYHPSADESADKVDAFTVCG